MATEYQYSNINECICLCEVDSEGTAISGLEYDVNQSSISSANLQFCRWDEDTGILRIIFDGDLSQDDEDTLDSIVGDL